MAIQLVLTNTLKGSQPTTDLSHDGDLGTYDSYSYPNGGSDENWIWGIGGGQKNLSRIRFQWDAAVGAGSFSYELWVYARLNDVRTKVYYISDVFAGATTTAYDTDITLAPEVLADEIEFRLKTTSDETIKIYEATAFGTSGLLGTDVFGDETAQADDLVGIGGIELAGASDKASMTVDIPTLPRFPDIPGPMFPVIMTPSFDVGVIPYVDGGEQRVLGIDEPGLKIGLQYKLLGPIDKETILAFFVARKGKAETFYWVNPENSIPYIVRFWEDILNVEYFAYELWNFAKVGFVETFWRAP